MDSWSAAPAACKQRCQALRLQLQARRGGRWPKQALREIIADCNISCQPDVPERLVAPADMPTALRCVALTLAAATRVDRSGLAAATSATVWHCEEGQDKAAQGKLTWSSVSFLVSVVLVLGARCAGKQAPTCAHWQAVQTYSAGSACARARSCASARGGACACGRARTSSGASSGGGGGGHGRRGGGGGGGRAGAADGGRRRRGSSGGDRAGRGGDWDGGGGGGRLHLGQRRLQLSAPGQPRLQLRARCEDEIAGFGPCRAFNAAQSRPFRFCCRAPLSSQAFFITTCLQPGAVPGVGQVAALAADIVAGACASRCARTCARLGAGTSARAGLQGRGKAGG